MPIERWTTTQVLALAPDASSAKGAQSVSVRSKWQQVGLDDTVLWGLCRGSGSKPYQACVDLTEPAYRCSCPSRKFPCKHALGLLLLWAAGAVSDGVGPDWVAEWRDKRAARSERATTRRTEGGPADVEAARKRAEQRAGRVAAGLAELDRWLLDQVSQGLAGAERAGHRPYETMAARLVDAQAPGAANAVRRLGGVVGVGPAWADRLLGELALLRLLVTGHERIEALPAPLADTVRSRIGIPIATDDVLAGPPARDRWQVLGQVDLVDDKLTTRRTWLHGAGTGRFALLLSFAAPGQAFPADVGPGTTIDADLC
ncbi:MAG TPA: SWIM zinc finger family protein, partial [Micromonospora sp.]